MKLRFLSAKQLIFPLLLIPLSSFGVSLGKISTKKHLITFSPDIVLKSGESCQGVRLSDEYIATSPECFQKIRELSTASDIQVMNESNLPIGELEEDVENEANNHFGMKLPITYHEESINPEYPAIRSFSPDISGAYTYLPDDDGSLHQASINLIPIVTESNDQTYLLFDDELSSSGRPVFDTDNKIICISSRNHQCIPLPQAIRSKRDNNNQVGEDENQNSSTLTTYVIIGGVILGAAVLANLACLGGIHARACAKGMPLKVLWSALIHFTYCKSPHTDYCLLCGWPGVAWSWIGAYQEDSQFDPLIIRQNPFIISQNPSR